MKSYVARARFCAGALADSQVSFDARDCIVGRIFGPRQINWLIALDPSRDFLLSGDHGTVASATEIIADFRARVGGVPS